MLLLSPALIWHWLPAEGGPEAAAAAQPRPPGIFERCSWVPAGWQTWQRRVGWTPKPTTRRGWGWLRGSRRRRQERLATQRPAEGDAGSLARPRPGQEPALPVARRRGPGAMLGRPVGPGCSGSPGGRLLGDRGHIVPMLGPAWEQAVASTPVVLPGGEAQSPTPTAPGPSREPILTNTLEAVLSPPRALATGLNPAL